MKVLWNDIVRRVKICSELKPKTHLYIGLIYDAYSSGNHEQKAEAYIARPNQKAICQSFPNLLDAILWLETQCAKPNEEEIEIHETVSEARGSDSV